MIEPEMTCEDAYCMRKSVKTGFQERAYGTSKCGQCGGVFRLCRNCARNNGNPYMCEPCDEAAYKARQKMCSVEGADG